MSNIGIVFTKMGQYNDAITSFEHIMQDEADFKTGFNLILCYFALGDREKMKRAFQKLLTVDLKVDDEEKYTTTTVCQTSSFSMSEYNFLHCPFYCYADQYLFKI